MIAAKENRPQNNTLSNRATFVTSRLKEKNLLEEFRKIDTVADHLRAMFKNPNGIYKETFADVRIFSMFPSSGF